MSAEKDKASAEKLIEDGVGLVAQGMFRLGSTNNDPQAAYDAGMTVVSVVRDMAFDFARKAGVFEDKS